ncbi:MULTISPECIES: META domain-containing protein [unclassified Campylobacter]|uniref:META domain-containing protein n=1 Tax=unclassified Campylobacter TaxID=2593542 RepID=UPI001237A61E|nr:MULTISPECIES: META domain-containing protein [unclassified Campylobacter]KAA6226415.1 META domain-containing protein [Campylobacter sp. LR286c]KAA6233867.1 META domain-containing protein [Campylobacter sp. LR264d]
MKKLLILFIFLFFISCATKNSAITTQNTTIKDKINIQNQLFELEKFSYSYKIYSSENFEEKPNLRFENGRFYGDTACNRFFGTYIIDGDILEIRDGMGVTKMLCASGELMEFEDSFLKNFKGSFEISKEENYIVLVNDNMKLYLKF